MQQKFTANYLARISQIHFQKLSACYQIRSYRYFSKTTVAAGKSTLSCETTPDNPEVRNSRASRFLPFDEAREYVQRFAFTSRKEYDEFWQRERPKFLPCQPQRIYSKSWLSSADFCGYHRTPRLIHPSQLTVVKSDHFTTRRSLHLEGVEWFLDLAKQYVTNFEIHPGATTTQAELLCRPRGLKEDLWIPLSFRAKTSSTDGAMRFSLTGRLSDETSWILICKDKDMLFMVSAEDAKFNNISITTGGKYGKFAVKSTQIESILESWWNSAAVPKISRWRLSQADLRTSLLLQLEELCYRPTGVGLKPASIFEDYDSVCAGKTLLHRVACPVYNDFTGCGTRKLTSYMVTLIRRVSKTLTYVDIESSADIYPILFHENQELQRMVFLPRNVLSILLTGKGESNKKSSHLFYPSTIKPAYNLSKKKQEIILPYEIDLRQPLHSGPERDKFLNILYGETD